MKRGVPSASQAAFTLAEMLVATAVLLILLIVLLQAISGMTTIWHTTSGSVSGYEAARSAFTTLNRVLSRATLQTYVDYIDNPTTNNNPFGNFRSSLSTTSSEYQNFMPSQFARASELHFLTGPASTLLTGATATTNPGDAAFFQAPLGVYSTSADKYLRRSLNDVGFYIQYGKLDTSIFPAWFTSSFVGDQYGFRLIQYVEPTESVSVYSDTSTGTYNDNWLPTPVPTLTAANVANGSTVLAENVLLLIIRPRLEPQDEQTAAPTLSETYSTATVDSIISPNYNYDSRAWVSGYPSFGSGVKSKPHARLMRNQLPPIVDVIMVCADPNTLVHLHLSATPPTALLPTASMFTKSDDTDLDADLTAYGAQLTAQHVRYRVFRSSVEIQSAAWADE
jgi:uncharacterized protein (TIGR02599 family)